MLWGFRSPPSSWLQESIAACTFLNGTRRVTYVISAPITTLPQNHALGLQPVDSEEVRPAKPGEGAPRRKKGLKELVKSPFPEVTTLYNNFMYALRQSFELQDDLLIPHIMI